LHQATSPRIPENFPFKSANSPFAEQWRTADRKHPLPIPLRIFFQAEWYLSPSSAHKSAFLLYHFLVLTGGLLTVDYRIKVHMDLQADKSPIVVKGPFFPQVVNPRYRIRGTMCNARIQSSKVRIAIL
jgi:hypothetical protein